MNPESSNQSDSFEVNNPGFSTTNGRGAVYSETQDPNTPPGVVFMKTEAEISQGPLPPPRILKEYNDIIKDGAERIMVMAEKEQAARIKEREKNFESNRKLAERKLNFFKRGQWMGFSLAIIVMALACLFAFNGFETLAMITLGSTIVGLVALFVYSTKNQQKE